MGLPSSVASAVTSRPCVNKVGTCSRRVNKPFRVIRFSRLSEPLLNSYKKIMMSNKMINRKQRFFAFRRAHAAGVAILLVILVLGVLGHWDLALTLVGMVIFLSISVLLFSTARQVNRDYGFHDNRLPFNLTFYNMLNS